MVTPEEAIKRRGGEGRLVNREYVRKYNEAYLKYFRTVQYPKELINTEMKEPCEVSKQVSDIILNYYR